MFLSDRDFSREFVFQASRSSGPGGQNVNKVSSRVELRFDVAGSQLLSDEEKRLVMEKLANKINSQQELILVSQQDRSQLKNREKVVEKFYGILAKALEPQKRRIRTRPSRASVEKRLESKRAQSEIKALRRGAGQ